MTTKLLDCTLRDGGYYNNWDFPPEIVSSYLKAIALSGIDVVELGLRNFTKTGFLGAFAYTTEPFIDSLDLPQGITYGVMVDAKTILSSDLDTETAIEALFVPASESKIDLVRIAAHFKEVEQCGAIAKKLKKMGYIVGFNLMQATGKSDEILIQKAKQVSEWDAVDVLYFADSLGNMDGNEVKRIITALKKSWNGELGIHTHDNISKGLDNSLIAQENGVSWLDATITGMGRGAGNTQTENLLAVLVKLGANYNPNPIYDLVIRHFEPMQKAYGWGTNLLYFLGAQNEVHPTYIQNLLSNTHFGTDEIIGAIAYLSNLEGTTAYNGAVLDTALNFNTSEKEVSGTTKLLDKFKNQEILILANGSSTEKYKTAIELYIKEKKPIVLSINLNRSINNELIDYVVISHNVKFLSESDKYNNITQPVILPKHRFNQEEKKVIEQLSIIDVGFNADEKHLSATETYTSSPYDLTSAYLLGLLLIAKPKAAYLVGFDGYGREDKRQQEMLDLLSQFTALENPCDLIALTPTSYPIQQGSIYAIN